MPIPGLDLLAYPLGWVLWFIYHFISNYFVAIFLFTLLVRAATFPLSLKMQKSAADRARLAPRLERIQKKYAKDPKKLQEKQMTLYQKEGVSMTAGCLPSLVQMVILFGIIAVIYAPLTHLARIPSKVITTSIQAVAQSTQPDPNDPNKTVEVQDPAKLSANDRKGYYKELRLLLVLDKSDNKEVVINSVNQLSDAERDNKPAEDYYDQMMSMREDFSFFGDTMLRNPWNEKGFAGINILWLIPLFSWLTAMGSSLLSMKFMNTAQGIQQPGQGCMNNSMVIVMPLFSLYITFIVPGAVGIYWICSNVIAIAQTIVLNQIYNPVKIRAQAEIEYEERRKQKLEDKKRLTEARAREDAEARRLASEEKQQAEDKRKAANAPKQAAASKNPNKRKRRENGESEQQESADIDAMTDESTDDGDDISEE